jgi:signal transduction histidine kinase/ligand-binding sensor domain-containing protein/AraC-like DNA-binding protein
METIKHNLVKFFNIYCMNRFTILSVIFLLFNISAFANISFKHITTNQGLSDNYVENVFEDRNGFIWIGTSDGLDRYDGKNFKSYRFYDLSGNPEVRNYVTAIVDLNDQDLFIGTLNGIYKYLYKCDSIIKFDDNGLLSSRVETFQKDESNNIWIATNTGLLKYNVDTDKLESFVHNENDTSSLLSSFLYTILYYDNAIWVGSNAGGLDKFSTKTNTARHYNTEGIGVPGKIIRALFIDKSERFWVASSYVGLFVREKGQKIFRQIHLEDNITKEKIIPNFSSINQDVFGNIWIGTYDKGLFVINPVNGNQKQYTEDSEVPSNLSGNSIDNIYRDSNGIMWLSTHGGGVSYFTPANRGYQYVKKSLTGRGLPGKFVSSFLEDEVGNVWIGTDGNGLSYYNKTNDTYTNYSEKHGLSSNAVLDITDIGNNKIAIATWNGGLNIFDLTSKKFETHLYNKSSDFVLQNHITGFQYDKLNNNLLCASFNKGIQVFDITKNRFYTEEELNAMYPNLFSEYLLKQVYFDVDSSIWVLDSYFFFKIINDSTKTYTYSQPKGCDSINSPVQILTTKDGTLWLASNKGLFKLDREIDCFYKIPDPEGFMYDIKSIVEDKNGYLWVSSAQGIIKFNLSTYETINLSKKWGIHNMQFFFRSGMRSNTGWLYFGGVDGYITLHEDSVLSNVIDPPIFFTDFTLFFKSGHRFKPVSKNISNSDSIFLSHYENYFNISFASLNYIDNEKSLYRYKLIGIDKNWIEIGTESRVSYTNLPPGNYKFVVNTTNSIGEWSNFERVLYIQILPPWWDTLIFKIFVVIIFIILIWSIVYFREKNIKQRNKLLTSLVDDKTDELRQTNKILRTTNIQLKQQKEAALNQNENLKDKQLVIELKNNQLQEAIETKDQLTTVIIHDLKNPLSTIFAFSKLLFEDIDSLSIEDRKKYLNHIANSSEKLVFQIENLMDWAIGKTSQLKYNPVIVNPSVLVNDAISLMYESALRKQISIKTEYDFSAMICVDAQMMSTVFRNLLSNSLKFTPRGGEVIIIISEADENINIEFKDTGIGIEEKRLSTIFEKQSIAKSTFGTEQEKGTGIGLAIVKQFIDTNKGKISVKSKEGEGTSFLIELKKSEAELELPNNKKYAEIPEILYHDSENDEDEYTMLVIDDNADITNLMNILFQNHFKVITASNGRAGLELAQENLPDIILSDIDMPLMNGKQMCNDIKTNPLTSHIPVILISGLNKTENMIDGYLHLADDYILKPFDPKILKQKILAIIKNRELLIGYYKNKFYNINEDTFAAESYDDQIIKSAIEIISENYSNTDFSVALLADKLSLSRVQLYRKFKAVTGYMPVEYIKDVRLKEAAKRLKTKKFRVSDVAYEVGFADPKYFSSCFRKAYGVSPKEYIESSL